jgi:hypothetical protein
VVHLGVPSLWEDAVAVGEVLEGGEGPRVVVRATILELVTEYSAARGITFDIATQP